MMWLMFLRVLTIMNKRFRYMVASLFSALGFFFFISLPYESRYFGLMVGIVLVVFCFWFGLGVIFEKSLYLRIMTVLLPICFFIGFGMFVALLPYGLVWWLISSVIFGFVLYVMFLVENVFMVAIGFRTVPLYRAAYTVSLIVLLLSSFFMFDSLLSFRLAYYWNGLWVFLISLAVFAYQFWAIAIELPDDGAEKNMKSYIIIPSVLMSQLAILFSFWPVGIFKGSVYLVSVVYIMSGLIQADIRDRLFKAVWLMYSWVAVAISLAILMITKWA